MPKEIFQLTIPELNIIIKERSRQSIIKNYQLAGFIAAAQHGTLKDLDEYVEFDKDEDENETSDEEIAKLCKHYGIKPPDPKPPRKSK